MSTNTEADTIDVTLIGGGDLKNVPVMRELAGRHYGAVGLMPVTERDPYTFAPLTTAADTGRFDDTYAVVAYLHGASIMPVCIGFLPPGQSEMAGRSQDGQLKRPANSSLRRERGHQVEIDYEDGTRELLVRGGTLRIGPHATIGDEATKAPRTLQLAASSMLWPALDPALHPSYDPYFPERYLDPSGQLPSRAGFWFKNMDSGAELQITEAGSVSLKSGKTPQRTVNGTNYPRSWSGMTLEAPGDLSISVGAENAIFGDSTTGYAGSFSVSARGSVAISAGGSGNMTLSAGNDMTLTALGVDGLGGPVEGNINLVTTGASSKAKVNGEQVGVLPGTGSLLGTDYHAARVDHKHTFSDSHFLSGSQIQSSQHPVISSGDLHPEYTTPAEVSAQIASETRITITDGGSGQTTGISFTGNFGFRAAWGTANVFFPDTFGEKTVQYTGHGANHAGGGSDPLPLATTSIAGLLSSTDKTKIDSLAGVSLTSGKTLSVTHSMTLSATADGFTATLAGTGTISMLGLAQTYVGAKTFTGGLIANSAITGNGTLTLTGTGNSQLSGSLGLGAAPTLARLLASVAYTDAGVKYGMQSAVTSSVTANGSNIVIGVESDMLAMSVPAGVSDSGYRAGLRGSAYANTGGFAGTLAAQYGVWGRVGINTATSGAVVTTARAGYFEVLNGVAGATIDTAIGVYISNSGTGGTINNRFDLYAASANAKSYFAGKVGLGTETPTLSGTGLLDMAADTFRLRSARTPATATAAGNAGEVCWDSSFLYVATGTNAWKRVALASW